MVDVAILIVRNHIWVHTEGHPDGIVVSVVMIDVGNIEAEAGADNLVNLGVNTTLEAVLALFVTLIYTFLLVVADSEVIVNALTSTIYCEIVVLLAS